MSTADSAPLPDPEALVHGDAVDPRVYTDPAVFSLEMQRLWARSWLYVGHESQVPGSGDFLTTTLATRPVILCRDDDGALQVLYNRCAHKGAQLLCEPGGQRRNLQCPYHGWTYALDGRLIARQRDSSPGSRHQFGSGKRPFASRYADFGWLSCSPSGHSRSTKGIGAHA